MTLRCSLIVLLIAAMLWGCSTIPDSDSSSTVDLMATATVPIPSAAEESDRRGDLSDRTADPVDSAEAGPNNDTLLGEDIAGIAIAANTFLALLDESQVTAALLPSDSELRANWSNLPASRLRFARNGVRIGDLNDRQTAAMLDFLTQALSEQGLTMLHEVMAAEGVLAESSQARRLGWSEDNYWLAFFGQPSATTSWHWQFGGHHLAINMAVASDRITMSPTFIGIEPAVYPTDDGIASSLTAAWKAGLNLMDLLEEPVRSQTVISRRPGDILTGAGKDGLIPPLQGSVAADWDTYQQAALLEAISIWVGILPSHSAKLRMADIESHLADTHFAWYGPTDGSGPIYYRIQGPTLIIEFSTESALGHEGGHLHSIYRDPPGGPVCSSQIG